MSSVGLTGLDSSVLLSYYQTQISSSPTAVAAQNALNATSSTQTNNATANDDPPWENPQTNSVAQTAQVLSTTNFLNTSNVPLSAGATSDAKLEQDNQKLFSLYTAVNSLAYLAKIAQGSTETSGQLAGLNARFQTGLSQVEQYLSSTSFNNYTLQAATPAASTTSTATIPFGGFTYNTKQLVTNAAVNSPLPGVSASDSFTISVNKAGTTTQVLYQFATVRRRFFDTFPEDAARRHVHLRYRRDLWPSDHAGRQRNRLALGGIDAFALSGGQFRHGDRGQHHNRGSGWQHQHHHHARRSERPSHQDQQSGRHADRRRKLQSNGHHGHDNGPGDRGGFQRQCLCAGQRHWQFRQPDQPGHAGRLSHQI
jgi:hypothetical protein